MPIRVRLYKSLLIIIAALTLSFLACGGALAAKTKLIVWGPIFTDRLQGWEAAFHKFEKAHPGVEVRMLSMNVGGMSAQKLMTAIVGNSPPDVILQGRHTIADWASRDTFLALDDYIAKDRSKPDGLKPEEYYPVAWDETIYKGKCYAIPNDVDDRILYYNKTIFRQAGLDPNKPPRTWEELMTYAKKLTVTDSQGNFKRLGFMPNFGNAWLYLYSWENGGEFMSADGKRCTMNSPENVEALKWMTDFCDAFGGQKKVNAFASGFKWNELDPFLIGQIAMKVDVSGIVCFTTRYNPGLDFGVAPPPVPAARLEGKGRFAGKDPYITWTGGFSWVIPRGARKPDLSWEFIKWMVSEEGERTVIGTQKKYEAGLKRPYVPYMCANARVNEKMIKEFLPRSPKLKMVLDLAISMLRHSRARPTVPVGQMLWDEHARAIDMAAMHVKSPKAALDEATIRVQRELNKIAERERLHRLNMAAVYGVLGVAMLAAGLLIRRKLKQLRGMGRLARREMFFGYLFVLPCILGFLIFTAGPIISSFIISFCDYDVLHPPLWVGLKNYQNLFGEDWYYVSKAMYNVGFLALFGIGLGMAVSLGIAMLLNVDIRGIKWYRTIFYMPSIVPVVANSILWVWILNPQSGLINIVWRFTLTNWFKLDAPLWLGSEQTAKPALVLMGLWGAGGGMILWLAGLKGIPSHLYEAAALDGAGWWGRLRHVTLPMLTPYIFYNMIMGTIAALQTFDSVYIMTNDGYGHSGGPVDSTLVPVLYLFNNAFGYFKMGYASAIAWIMFLIIVMLTVIQFKLASKWVHYGG